MFIYVGESWSENLIQIDKREILSCCGKKQLIWKISVPLKKEHLDFFQQAGFSFVRTYLDAGMMYIENKGLIATGIFGLNEIKIKCKNSQCNESSQLLEKTILIYL